MADPLGKAARVARSRAACAGCRQTKQRCDGPSRIPCRRCELYGLACEYPPSSGPAASKPAPARPPVAPYQPPIGMPFQDPQMADRLREISERLRSIESSLEAVHLTPTNSTRHLSNSHSHDGSSPSSLPSLGHPHSADTESTSSQSVADAGHLSSAAAAGSNPMQTVISQIDAIEAIAKGQSPDTGDNSDEWFNGISAVNTSVSRLFAGHTMPDAVVRGIMSVEECEASFSIFFAKMAPWVMFLDQVRDRDASAMRERSPILFHVILLSTSYYLMEASERGTQVYYALTALVNELLAPVIISAQPHQVNSDFVRSLCLLLLYKPVQYASLYTTGISAPAAAEHAAKLNGFSSSVLGGLMIRTSNSIGLPSVTSTFTKTFSPNIAIAPQVLSDLRLHYWLCVVDTHGALTTGRAGSADISDALRTTRLFATLKSQLWDVRLAATVELYATAKHAVSSMWSSGNHHIPPHELRKFNKDMDEWEAYWSEPLREASEQGDQIAYTVRTIFCEFIRVVINASVFFRWAVERKESISRGEEGRPALTDDDWSFLSRAVASCEKIVFSLSTESRVGGSPIHRKVTWPETVSSTRPPLNLDPVVVDIHRTAFDTITCIVYIFTLIFLAKMANTGLIRCELNCLIEEYRAGISLHRPQRLLSGAKLGRLLELGAAFLEAISPTGSHPAKKHARVLRAILAAGTMGQLAAPVDGDPDEKQDSQNDNAVDEAQGNRFDGANSHLSQPSMDTQFDLSTMSYHPEAMQDHPSQPAVAVTDASGEALAAILGGLSPSWLGQIGYLDGGPDFGAGNEMATVDWDALEKSINLQRVQTPAFTPLPTGYFSMSHNTAHA